MSEMLTDVNRIVNEDISNRTTQKDALYEAITNSIDANASQIICRMLGEKQEVLSGSDGEYLDVKKVISIEIEDNGDGFNDANYQSFGKYRTDHKISKGCKGVGRFVFLKLFNNVSYTSWQAREQIKREFKLTFDFESEDLVETKEKVKKNKTILKLSEVSNTHFGRDSHLDRRLELNISEIKNDILLHLIPTLYFCKKNGKQVEIKIVDSLGGESKTISEDDIPDFSTKKFHITDTDGKKIAFDLHHFVEPKKGKVHALYCANKRSVCPFSSQKFKPQGFKGVLLLESAYLDDRINNSRNDFDIYPIQTDMLHKLSWELINKKLKSIILDLVQSKIPDVADKNRVKLEEIQEERPYLMQYIDEEDVKIAGFISKKQIVNRAKKRFNEAKDRLLENRNKDEYSDEDLNEAIMVTQNELIAYIHDRVAVIEQLKTMIKDKEQTESVIHNLFMKQYTEDDQCDYFSPKRNNLWLLDDRFTSYSYAASDKMIKDVLDQVGSDDDSSKPDLSLFFSQSPENKDGLQAVIVELKSFDDSKRYSNKKMAGITQLLDYIDAFKLKESIESVWAFLVTDVDDRFAYKLKRDGFKFLFSVDTPIYHKYYEESDSSIYVVGAKALILDAEARNKVFIDIVNKQSRLKGLLGKENLD